MPFNIPGANPVLDPNAMQDYAEGAADLNAQYRQGQMQARQLTAAARYNQSLVAQQRLQMMVDKARAMQTQINQQNELFKSLMADGKYVPSNIHVGANGEQTYDLKLQTEKPIHTQAITNQATGAMMAWDPNNPTAPATPIMGPSGPLMGAPKTTQDDIQARQLALAQQKENWAAAGGINKSRMANQYTPDYELGMQGAQLTARTGIPTTVDRIPAQTSDVTVPGRWWGTTTKTVTNAPERLLTNLWQGASGAAPVGSDDPLTNQLAQSLNVLPSASNANTNQFLNQSPGATTTRPPLSQFYKQ